jgi:hypothetical protein
MTNPTYGYAPPFGQAQNVAGQDQTAVTSQPSVGQMGGVSPNQPAWFRFPFFPTAPYISTNPNVSSRTRYYSTTVTQADTDLTVGAEMIRNVTFDIPVRIVAISGKYAPDSAHALPAGMDYRDAFLFRAEYTTGDRLHIAARLGSTVVGTAGNPGEIGGTGYTIDQGASLTCGITPRAIITASNATAWRIDITFHCLEIRGSANFVGGR